MPRPPPRKKALVLPSDSVPPSGGCKRTPCSSSHGISSVDLPMVSSASALSVSPAGDAIEIVEEFGLLVGPGHGRRGAVVGAAQVAGVAGIAAAVELGRALDHDDAGAAARRGDGGAQSGVAATQHHDVKRIGKIERRHGFSRFETEQSL